MLQKSILYLIFCIYSITTATAIGVGVAPANMTFDAHVGIADAQSLFVINDGSDVSNYRIYVDDQYVDWFTISPNNFTLQPGENKEVTLAVKAPMTANGIFDLKAYVIASAPSSDFEIGSGIKIPVHINVSNKGLFFAAGAVIVLLLIGITIRKSTLKQKSRNKVVYYDYKAKETTETPISSKNVSIVCPMLRSKEISEIDWRNTLIGLTKAEETSEDIDMPASTLFDILSDVLQDMNLFMLEPKINDSGNLYRAVSKFYGEGVKSLKYAAQIEVVGSPSKSKLILKAWAGSEGALAGFYHGILNEIEKRVQVKSPISTTVVNNYHYGNSISTQITDSVVQHSNIGNNGSEATNEKISEDGPGMNFSKVYTYLIDKAMESSVVTYSEVVRDLGEEFNPQTRDKLISLLDRISKQNIEKGEPLLTALVVSKAHRMPGKRFFTDYMSTYRNFTGNPEGNEAQMAYKQELERVWNYW